VETICSRGADRQSEIDFRKCANDDCHA
jgi:hypothetical protein